MRENTPHMKTALPILATVLACLAPGAATAQTFTGSDDFNSPPLNTATWSYNRHLHGDTNGLFSVTTDRLDFTKDAGSDGSMLMGWNQLGSPNYITPASFTTSWVMDLQVTNTMALTSASQFASIGFEITDSNHWYELVFSSTNAAHWFHVEDSGTGIVSPSALGNTDAYLRMTWDANAQILAASYSFDGVNYTEANAFNPVTSWSGVDLNKGFWFEIFALTQGGVTDAITAGTMSADNFSITAVPEPATYAALAGLAALGLAAGARRRTRGTFSRFFKADSRTTDHRGC